jgi:hypothetical protein
MIVIDQTILDTLEHYPFSLIRELTGFTCIPTTAVHRHSTQSPGFVVKRLRWVPHTLTSTQKRNVLLSQLSSCASSGPHTARKCRAFCEENWLRLAVHPPPSPDLAPSDFFLFGHIKHCIQGIAFQPREELLAAIYEIVGTKPRPILE